MQKAAIFFRIKAINKTFSYRKTVCMGILFITVKYKTSAISVTTTKVISFLTNKVIQKLCSNTTQITCIYHIIVSWVGFCVLKKLYKSIACSRGKCQENTIKFIKFIKILLFFFCLC